MKGQDMPESIGITLVFLVIFVGLVVVAFLVYVKLNISSSGDPIAYSVDFVSIATKPYVLAEILTHVKIEDRQVLEHSIEIMSTSVLENAQSEKLPKNMRNLVSQFEFKTYRMAIERDGVEIMSAEKGEQKCGENNAGWCVDAFTGCDVGRIKIDAKGACRLLEVCCKADASYSALAKIPCSDNQGVCSEGETTTTFVAGVFYRYGPFCTAGQIYLGDPKECKDANNGKTPICCAERTDELAAEKGLTAQAVIPLLFRDKSGQLEVEAK
jgi:hypothetical protein